MKNRITELLEQIQKDFLTSSENIGKIKGMLENEEDEFGPETFILKIGRAKWGESKFIVEDERPEINSYEDAFRVLRVVPTEFRKNCESFEKRLIIAKALGARPFVYDERNFYAEKAYGHWRIEDYTCYESEGSNFFQTKEQAQKYLNICLKEGLL